MKFKERLSLKKGVGVNFIVIKGDLIYTVGLFNTSYGLNSLSGKNHYPWCGVFAIINRDKQNSMIKDFL